ncbi:glutamine-synthetase adenylyltransferase [Rhodobacteraceae bacterium 2376]|uniref:Glutamine-synthetase adenylyltransferase n=1 Tax=Rhabdonatronobacter sediminivivens TaxID=2743469 RepID=A0A7Z0KY77_9RHOB|nr:glutamine-synthetase adenylyltransferase [Rhabdonatronobacter sediminivivens]NYS24261.1 glutamine-synthetase adenylyltransferase [Rhabdonatronobacter sediminivivens]
MSHWSLTRCPIPHDPEAGAEARALFPDLPADLAGLIEGAAGCSPYLKGLMGHERDWLPGALADDPAAVLAAELAALDPEDSALAVTLRRAKRRVALLAALADLGGVWDLDRVTGALTDLADAATRTALAAALGHEIRRRKLPGAAPEDAATGAGMVVLAMGKMGARELNYSSDIDLICLFDETRFDADDYHDARAAFIRATRRMCALLSDHTGDGYVFRTDLRLRPDPSVTPVCLSMEAAERYYESLGRTWERAAYIKARPCAGDIAAGQRFLQALTPFVWRRHLDFAAIQDAHDMRLRIRAHKGLGGALVLDGHNMKLGRGGIREIEFFTQTRQIIAGGRDPDLRSSRTEDALAALAAKGWVPADVARELAENYRHHREVEHRLQMIQDAQTQTLPNAPEGFDRLARFMGAGDTDRWRKRLKTRLARVHDLTEGFFAPGTETAPEPELSESAQKIVSGWRAFAALRSDRAQQIFDRLRPEILRRMQQAANPEEALIQFDHFLGGLPAGVQIFSLFEANPQLIDLLVDICATAPRLAAYLSRNSGVLDAVIGGDFFAPWPGTAALGADLSARLKGVDDYERKLDGARVWAREWHFRIGVHHLRGLIDAAEAGAQYAQLAEATLAALWPHVVAEFARKHGPPPGRGAVVLGMGSLGAARLNAASDLDLIVIYDPAGAEGSDGPRPLGARPYYARLTQAFVTAISAPMAGGRLYEVDMRLRPSGRQGPVATSLDAFRNYQQTEAWTWEHLALTRARRVAGCADLGAEVEAFRRALLPEKGRGAEVRADVAAMRARLAEAKPGDSRWEAKDGPGRLQDIELAAQTCALLAGSHAHRVEAQLLAGRRAGVLDPTAEAALLEAYRLCWRMQCSSRLLADRVGDPQALGQGGQALILRETGAADLEALAQALQAQARGAAAVIAEMLDSAPATGQS